MKKRTRFLHMAALVLAACMGSAAPALGKPPSLCGDGVIEVAEICDDENSDDGDGCSSNCLPELCGDGILENNGQEPDEECDDGNTWDGDGCQGDCTCGPCGDGVQCGFETCDDGNTIDDDACSNDCSHIDLCGNGIIDGVTEECDDGNTVVGDGCDPACQIEPVEPYPPTKADQACVNGINKAWAGVIRATNKAGGKCLKGVSNGKASGTFADCAQAADLGKAFDKTTKANQKKCVGKVDARMFGSTGDVSATNMAGFAAALGAQADLLGSPANVVPKSDKEHAKCQREVHKGLVQYLDGLAADANQNKKLCLKGKKVAQCQTPDGLATAVTAAGSKASHALPRWTVLVAKRCADTTETIASLFPGLCAGAASYGDLVTCSARRAKCRFCTSLNAADGLSIDCAEYAADPLNCAGD